MLISVLIVIFSQLKTQVYLSECEQNMHSVSVTMQAALYS